MCPVSSNISKSFHILILTSLTDTVILRLIRYELNHYLCVVQHHSFTGLLVLRTELQIVYTPIKLLTNYHTHEVSFQWHKQLL